MGQCFLHLAVVWGSTLGYLADSVSLCSLFSREQEAEIARLRSLTVDIRAQLQHGLEGLTIFCIKMYFFIFRSKLVRPDLLRIQRQSL